MGGPPNSQAVAYPAASDLPFRLISKNIGAGAYASIRKAIPKDKSGPVIAVKFINKQHAMRVGRLSARQLALETSIHSSVCANGGHQNIIRLLQTGEDAAWHWIAMELAAGGDLFDKIEADEGVPADVAHFYFKQLVCAVSWCHSKGVAHRDIKPENMLLSQDGDLKLGDFGLATLYLDNRTGRRKQCTTVCGSPPYIAPEIIAAGLANQKRKKAGDVGEKDAYDPDKADLWSCAIVLFVLLVGNTPWDSPVPDTSAEYADYIATSGHPSDELWDNVPSPVLSLLRAILRPNPKERFSLHDINIHPWFSQPNRFMDRKGRMLDGVAMATSLMERMRIDPSEPPPNTHVRSTTMTQAQHDDDTQAWTRAFPTTQPETPLTDLPFDFEPTLASALTSASQPTTANDMASANNNAAAAAAAAQHLLETDISLSQFTNTQGLPLTLTQAARKFGDIVPPDGLTRFYSAAPGPQLTDGLQAALLELGFRTTVRAVAAAEVTTTTTTAAAAAAAAKGCLYVQGTDGRKEGLKGHVLIENLGSGTGLSEVRFVKAKGDPVQWRRLFKGVVRGVRDLVFVPGSGGGGSGGGSVGNGNGGWSQF